MAFFDYGFELEGYQIINHSRVFMPLAKISLLQMKWN